jgi:eukaryotic-like serine/threonine-protein kinase
MTIPGPAGLRSRAEERVGTVLREKYRLESVLGVGGMAVVYKATHRNEAEFAIKILHPELSSNDDVRSRFLREGKAANSVKHPGAVLVVDDDVAEDGAAFLVMELLHGAAVENLWERCHRRLPLGAALSIADQLLDVLGAAHGKGIVHRDIKPANVFAMRDGTLKVLDFGIARVKEAAASQSVRATGTGMLLGTPAFMAPEQAYAKASEIDGQTDVWAVGATLFTLLSGQSVHEGENAAQLMIRAATTQARPLASLVSDVPPVVAQVIDRALAYDKASRWPSAAAMRQAIARASLAAFGERPSKSALAALVARDDSGLPTSYPGEMASPAGSTSASQTSHPTFRIAASSQPSGAGASRVTGATTAAPVSAGYRIPVTMRPRRGVITAAVASALAVALLGGGLAVRAAFRSTREPPGAGVSAPPAVATAVPPPMNAASASSPPPALLSATDGMAATGVPGAATGSGTNKPAAMPSARPVHRRVPPAITPAAPVNCDPPTWTEPNGHVHLKEGCK